jgi:hypothetical protein
MNCTGLAVVCSLFNDAISNSDHMALNCMVVTELERMEGSGNGPTVVLSYPGMYLKKQEKVFQPEDTFCFHITEYFQLYCEI